MFDMKSIRTDENPSTSSKPRFRTLSSYNTVVNILSIIYKSPCVRLSGHVVGWLVVACSSAESLRQGTSSAVSQSTQLDLVPTYARAMCPLKGRVYSPYPVITTETGSKHQCASLLGEECIPLTSLLSTYNQSGI